MAVKVIKAQEPINTRARDASSLRVAAYCRVSTDSDEQESSYEAQVNHYTSFIQSHPGWELAGIFADEGLSGTQAKTRPQFNAMIAACEEGNIDLVICTPTGGDHWYPSTIASILEKPNIFDLRQRHSRPETLKPL